MVKSTRLTNLALAIYILQDYYGILKDMIVDKEITEEEIVAEHNFGLKQMEEALAELHLLRKES